MHLEISLSLQTTLSEEVSCSRAFWKPKYAEIERMLLENATQVNKYIEKVVYERIFLELTNGG